MSDFLSAWDSTTPGKPHIPCYMFLTEALECCQHISDVQNRPRRRHASICADGKTNVYSNVASLATGEIGYTFGGSPATSHGNWQRLEWPWKD